MKTEKKTLFTIILFVNSMFPAHPRPSCNPLMPLSLRTQGLVQKVIKQWQWSCIIIAFFILHHNNVVWRKIMVGLKVFLLESHYSRLTHLRTTRSEKNIFSCIQQFIETDTFSQMKILQRFSLPGTTYFWHLHFKTVKHLLRLFSSLEADQLNFTLWKRTIFSQLKFFNSLASGCFRGFSEKKHLNACGFAWEFLRSGMLYGPGKSLKRCNKSSSLHSKKIFAWGCSFFVSDIISGGLLGNLGHFAWPWVPTVRW